MGKVYDYDTTSKIGGVAPEIQKQFKDLKKTTFNAELENFRKRKNSTPTPKKK